eukprot:gene12494-16761_t
MDPTEEDEELSLLPGINDLPEFASLESKKVHESNREKEREVETITDSIYDLMERVKVMKEHLKNVQTEVDHTNSLQNAKKAEILTEIHLKQLTSRGLGKSQTDSKKVGDDIQFTKDQLNTVQSLIHVANQKMDEFKLQMNWNQEELESWVIASKQKDEDAIQLEKYKRYDEMKIKELNLIIENLTKELLSIRAKVDSEGTETQAKQMELERIAVEFKNAHLERQTLVLRWQETIAEMKRRDKEINELGERYAIAKNERIKKETLCNQSRKKLLLQSGENKDVESKSELLSRLVLRKREEMMINQTKLVDFRSELDSLKNELTTAAESLVIKRASNTNLSNNLEEKRIILERERSKYSAVKAKVELAKTNTNKAEMNAKNVENELSEKENQFNNELNRNKLLKEKFLKEQQTVYDLRLEEGRLQSEISGNKSIERNLESQLNQLDKEAARQQELLYNAEFQIQQIERKIARGMGERSDEEKINLKNQIQTLESTLDEIKNKRKMLLSQTRKLSNELVALRVKKEDLNNKFSKFIDILNEKELENKMIEDEMKHDNINLEEMTVSNDLLRLEVRRLKDLLSSKSDAVFSLENRKQQLLLSLEERKQEIIVHRDILKSELKSLQDDKHKLVMELRDREANVNRLKARFESVARSEDEKHSQAYYIIKAAQRREELQRRGDQLDQDIRKCEREIRALNTTLDHLNARNTAYRESFQKIDLKGDEVEILKQLEDRTKLNKVVKNGFEPHTIKDFSTSNNDIISMTNLEGITENNIPHVHS